MNGLRVGDRVVHIHKGAAHQDWAVVHGVVVDVPGYGLGCRWKNISYRGEQASMNIDEARSLDALPELMAEVERHNAAALEMRAEYNRPERRAAREARARAAARARALHDEGLPAGWDQIKFELDPET